MDLDFNLSAKVEGFRLKTRDFINSEVLPLEADRANFDNHEYIRLDALNALRAKAKFLGLWAHRKCPKIGAVLAVRDRMGGNL